VWLPEGRKRERPDGGFLVLRNDRFSELWVTGFFASDQKIRAFV
jgi:hypothetical protein